MNALIIEDEFHAAELLKSSIAKLDRSIRILSTIESVSDAVQWLKTNPAPDLIFMDIHLADDLSFEIFKQVKVTSPVIFTTAYDQYAIRAFKFNGIDYLLKPISMQDLEVALGRAKQNNNSIELRAEEIQLLLSAAKEKKVYRERFLIPTGDQLKLIPTSDVAWFSSKSGVTTMATKSGQLIIISYTIEQLEEELNPDLFFRINRGMLIEINSIKKINQWFTRRYKLEVTPPAEEEIIVSRERVADFNAWLDR